MTTIKEMLRAFQRLDEERSKVAEEDSRTDDLFRYGVCCNVRDFMWWPKWDDDFHSERQKVMREFKETMEKLKVAFSEAKNLPMHPEDYSSGFFLWVPEGAAMSPEEQYDHYEDTGAEADPAFIKAFGGLREEFLQFCIEHLKTEAENETI